MERFVGFTEKEAEYFGNVVAQMMKWKEARKMEKPKKEKKAPKMKREELLRRLKEFLEHGVLSVAAEQMDEWLLLREELKKIIKRTLEV